MSNLKTINNKLGSKKLHAHRMKRATRSSSAGEKQLQVPLLVLVCSVLNLEQCEGDAERQDAKSSFMNNGARYKLVKGGG